jgi:hypothetical protein
MITTFSLSAVDTGVYVGLSSEHTYVLSGDGHVWNCFGRYDGGRLIRTAKGSSKWASLIYGPNERRGDDQAAAGLRVRYDGVCQNAANRILVLTGDNIDARETKGNVLATLMYGKFGLNLDRYVESVKSTGAQLLKTDPGEINDADIQTVLNRINQGLTPDAELDILHVDMKEQFSEPLPDITDAQRTIFRPIYGDYQNDRIAAFNATPKQYGEEIAQNKLLQSLIGPWTKCVERLITALGPEQFKDMLGVDPAAAKGKLPGI